MYVPKRAIFQSRAVRWNIWITAFRLLSNNVERIALTENCRHEPLPVRVGNTHSPIYDWYDWLAGRHGRDIVTLDWGRIKVGGVCDILERGDLRDRSIQAEIEHIPVLIKTGCQPERYLPF